ncbi:MAG: 3-phosphoshikimate 1-carboxyvinyltransferase [Ruminococcaceae bacterium]|nr:3-phosphoshikimate 1-carboxyvinyltransferase [Oscillospiraceae bacterium]
MDITIYPSKVNGTVKAIGSKSDIHRTIICAAMAEGETRVRGIVTSKDVLATAECIRALGVKVEFNGDECIIKPGIFAEKPHLDCGESGSTLRFLLPVTSASCGGGSFTGSGRLPERPLGELVNAMTKGEVRFTADRLPFAIEGRLTAGEYLLPGNVSSQYISGLLMALSITPGESIVKLTSKLESSAYVDMTLNTLRCFCAEIVADGESYIVKGKERLTSPKVIDSDGDWSNSAFFLVSGAIDGSVTVEGLRRDSLQGDKKQADILKEFGASVEWNGNVLTVTANKLQGNTVDLAEIPDALPVLAVMAAFSEGETHFTGGARLRLKESDRLKTVHDMITALGGKAVEFPDGLIVQGGGLTGGTVDGANDHRIVMAAAIAGVHCKEPVTIIGAEAVNKSYPDFFSDLTKLGGKCHVI